MAEKKKKELTNLEKLLGYVVNDSIPAEAVKAAWSGFTFPGDVYAGKASPYDHKRALDMAGLVTLGSAPIRSGSNELRMGVKLMSGKEAPSTETGWTFRDVKKPKLNESENKRWNSASMVPTTEVVPIRRLYATQNKVNPDFDVTETSAGTLPNVIRKDGEMFVMDGHHRLTKVAEEGGANARVNFFDFDAKDRSHPLLDYDEVKKAKQIAEDDELLKALLGGGLL